MTRAARRHSILALVLVAVAFWPMPSAKAADAGGPRTTAAKPSSAAPCAGCHGTSGEGQASFPRLAGLGAAYLLRQLMAFADGSRHSPVMAPIAAALSQVDRQTLANYYAGLPVAASASQPAPTAPAARASGGATAPTAVGSTLATRGRWSDGLPPCEQCHGPGGRGVGSDFPALAGQPADYLAGQLQAWKSGARPPGPLSLMAVVADKLSQAEMDAVALHYAAQPATTPVPAAKAAP